MNGTSPRSIFVTFTMIASGKGGRSARSRKTGNLSGIPERGK